MGVATAAAAMVAADRSTRPLASRRETCCYGHSKPPTSRRASFAQPFGAAAAGGRGRWPVDLKSAVVQLRCSSTAVQQQYSCTAVQLYGSTATIHSFY